MDVQMQGSLASRDLAHSDRHHRTQHDPEEERERHDEACHFLLVVQGCLGGHDHAHCRTQSVHQSEQEHVQHFEHARRQNRNLSLGLHQHEGEYEQVTQQHQHSIQAVILEHLVGRHVLRHHVAQIEHQHQNAAGPVGV